MAALPKFVQLKVGADLRRERRFDYQNVTLIQTMMVGLALVLGSYLSPDYSDHFRQGIVIVISLFGGAYFLLLWDMLRTHLKREWVLQLWLLAIVVMMLMLVAAEFPYVKHYTAPVERWLVLAVHLIIFPFELTVIFYLMKDIFLGNYMTNSKLWGAACVYLTIGIAFAGFFDILQMLDRDAFGPTFELGIPAYSRCLYHSFATLGGLDSAYSGTATEVVKNTTVLLAVWGNLFAVLIIGKLLTLPRKQ